MNKLELNGLIKQHLSILKWFKLVTLLFMCVHIYSVYAEDGDSLCLNVVMKDCVVTFDYTLKDDKGAVLDSTHGSTPRIYLQGRDDLLPSITRALNGRLLGEKFKLLLPPAQGYGEYDKNLIETVPISSFGGDRKIEKGMEFIGKKPDGSDHVISVVSVENGVVTVDGNHPLAGKTLLLDIEILLIRSPTVDELKNGVH